MQEFKFRGKVWNSYKKCSLEMNVPMHTIRDAVRRKGNDLDAANYCPRPKRETLSNIVYDGKTWPSAAALTAYLGCSKGIVNNAVRKHGRDLDSAGYRYVKQAGSTREYKYCGCIFFSMVELASEFGIKRDVLRQAVKKFGKNLDAAGIVFGGDDLEDWAQDLAPRVDLIDL